MTDPIVLIGGGLIGASIAYELSRRGREVTVIDRGGPSASAASFGWINASFFLSQDHYRLRLDGIEAWARLERDLGGVFNQCGAFVFDTDIKELGRSLSDLAYPLEDMSQSAFAAALPGITPPEDGAMFFPNEGCAETLLVAERLLMTSGARVIRGVSVEAIETLGDAVRSVRVPGGEIAASAVVVAAGIGSADLVEPLGVQLPMLTRPGMTMVSEPVSMTLGPVLATPAGEVRQLADGRLLASTAVSHQSDATDVFGAPPLEVAATAAARFAAVLPVAPLWKEVRAANRPMPGDGLPVVGPAGPEGLWLAVMHSGVTLGPLTGALIAAEMAGDAQPLLSSFRPQRFSS